MATAALQRINPDAALAFASREEMDATMGTAARAFTARSYCAREQPKTPPKLPMAGFDAFQFFAVKKEISRVGAPPVTKPTPPMLVMRAECDFVPWAVTRDYRDTFGAPMVVINGAGHSLWPIRASLTVDVLTAFFKAEPLPLPNYTDIDEPPSAE